MGGLVGGFTWVLSVRWVDMWAIWWVFELAGCLVGELTCAQSGRWVGELVSVLAGGHFFSLKSTNNCQFCLGHTVCFYRS